LPAFAIARLLTVRAPLKTRSTLADEGARIGGYMRRLITYFNSLLLGMILGMIFMAICHASTSVIARSASLAEPAGYQQPCSVMK
jgi:hypothetical protein